MLYFNLQSLLQQKGKTRYWLVKRTEMDYTTVNNIYKNKSVAVRLNTLERLMQALDCHIEDLFLEK